ncbi:ABC transporter permease [Enterococcus larvae]|uniref:ABC transporter permease n=1 Tax=Enterococcus larvae TaxID=2794352 RepID=UPI003F34AD02
MRKFLTLVKIEGKLGLRSLDGVLFGIGMPLGILVLISFIAGNQQVANGDYTFLDSSFSSLLAVGICATAFMGIPLTICDYRDKKILKHYCVTPASPTLILTVQFFVGTLTAVASALTIIFTATVFLGYQMNGSWLLLIGAYFLVMLSMYSIGMLIASLCPTLKIANLVCTFVYFPMLFLSGAVIPFELFPKAFQNVASVLPLTQGIKLLKSITLNEPIGNPLMIILLMVTITLICGSSAIKLFRWE